MAQSVYPSGSVRALLATGLVTPATRAALEARIQQRDEQPQFFDQNQFATLRAVVARLYNAPGDPLGVASAIDQRLAAGTGDGWRYDALPPDDTAFRQALAALAAQAHDQASSFAQLDQPTQDALIAAFKQAQPRFFEELLAECAEIAYSHPVLQEEIGYAGMADARGWQAIGLNEHEPWEPESSAEFSVLNVELPENSELRPQSAEFSVLNVELPENSELKLQNSKLDDEVDVVVIGTGAGGAPLLARLAAAGMQVVALEAGRFWQPQRDFATDERAQSQLFWNDERLSAGGDPVAFGRNNSGIGIGGSTLHYTAYTPRAHPDDFQLHSETGLGVDWPLGYADLEPYYDELEQFLGISGPSPYPWGPPRRRAYPLAPLPLNGAAQLMQRGCERMGIRWAPAANAALSARRYQPGYGWRAACTNRGFCQAGCSVGAKASMDVTFIPLAISAGAEVRTNCFVTGFERDPSGAISGVLYEQDGETKRQTCRAVFLCAGAIETPRLLLMNGLANSSGQVGRNFMAHVGPQVWAQFDDEVRPTKGIPGGLISEDTHRVAGGGFVGGYLLQSIGVMPVTYASQLARGQGLWGAALREHMRGFNHVAGINVLGDCLPSAQNYLELAEERDARGLPKPRVHFTAGPNEQRMQDHAVAIMQQIFAAAGARDAWVFPRFAHTIGTCRMGSDRASAVVDADCRSFDVPNLYVCDNSVFPSALSVNPALTGISCAWAGWLPRHGDRASAAAIRTFAARRID